MSEQQSVKTTKSSIINIPANKMSALVFAVPAAFAWIPVVGYFAWIIPMVVFLMEKNSAFVRFCAAEAFCIGIVRLVFDVVFDGIRNVALRTVMLYGSNPDFVNFWGSLSSPGHEAFVIRNIIAFAISALSITAAVLASNKKLLRMPIIGEIADFMTHELAPRFKHNTYSDTKTINKA